VEDQRGNGLNRKCQAYKELMEDHCQCGRLEERVAWMLLKMSLCEGCSREDEELIFGGCSRREAP
jgi:hypothetical protein